MIMTTLTYENWAGEMIVEETIITPRATPRRRWFRYTRNGGMRFLRVHRLQLSWCICNRSL